MFDCSSKKSFFKGLVHPPKIEITYSQDGLNMFESLFCWTQTNLSHQIINGSQWPGQL